MSDPDLSKIELFRYDLVLRRPLPVRDVTGRAATTRRGWVLALTDRNTGNVGYGDAAPLLFTPQALDRVEHNLAATAALMAVGESDAPEPGYAAIQFAISSARADLQTRMSDLPLHKYLNAEADDIVHVNGLVDDNDGAPEAVDDLLRAGYTCLKIKVGRRSVAEDAIRVLELAQQIGAGARIRLDANRAWTMPQALDFLQRTEAIPFEYIEEPLERPDLLEELYDQTGSPIALDESIPEFLAGDGDIRELFRHASKYCTTVVAKPMAIGPIQDTLSLARASREAGLDFVVSSSLESGFGLRTLSALAAATMGGPAGLGTQSVFRDDVCRPPVAFGATIDVAELWKISPHVGRANSTLLGSWKTL